MEPAFDPWIGEGYAEAEVRILIVGESHYDAPPGDARGFTSDVVEYWREQIEPMRFFDNVAGLLRVDVEAPQTGRELDSAAFYNFVQIGMATASDRPRREHLAASAACFPGVLERLAPTHVLVAGKTQWSYLPPFDFDLGKPVVGGKAVELGVYATPRGPALATCIPHPSWRFFTVGSWRAPVQAFLAMNPSAAIPAAISKGLASCYSASPSAK